MKPRLTLFKYDALTGSFFPSGHTAGGMRIVTTEGEAVVSGISPRVRRVVLRADNRGEPLFVFGRRIHPVIGIE